MTRARAVIALGTNLGDRLVHLSAAVAGLAATPGLRVVAVSPVYETLPVGGPAQPDYLNAVVFADSTLPAPELLRRAQAVEAASGRVRTERWGPRTLDIDLVAYDSLRADAPELTLPHPRAHERSFVLAPWADVDPNAELPGHGRVVDLLAGLGPGGVRRRDDLVLVALPRVGART